MLRPGNRSQAVGADLLTTTEARTECACVNPVQGFIQRRQEIGVLSLLNRRHLPIGSCGCQIAFIGDLGLVLHTTVFSGANQPQVYGVALLLQNLPKVGE